MFRLLWIVGFALVLPACNGDIEPSSPRTPSTVAMPEPAGAARQASTASSLPAAGFSERSDAAHRSDPLPPSRSNLASPATAREAAVGGPSVFAGNPQIDEWLNSPDLPRDGLGLREEMTSITGELARAYAGLPDLLELHARALALVGNLDEAKELWLRILQVDPDYSYALQGLGSAAKLDGQLETALGYFERAMERQSDNAKLVHELSETYNLLGRLEESASVLEVYASRHPDAVETLVLWGQALVAVKEFERAQAAFERALELHPELPRAQQGLGTVLVRLGKRDQARKLLDAQKATREQQDTTAIEPAVKLKMEMRDSAELYYLAARVLEQLGNMSDATSLLRRATLHHPQHLAAWRLWMKLAQPEGASQVLEIGQAMAQSNPNDPSVRYELGLLQLASGQFDDAVSSMESVMAISPNDPAGYEGHVRSLLAADRNTEEAIKTARRLTEIAPTAKSYDLMAQALAVGGRIEEAWDAIQLALEKEPDNPQYRFAESQLEKLMGKRP
jgi:tetratricopeptide (TPR) repeat protein